MKDDSILFESSYMNPNCLHTYLMEKIQENIKSMWVELGSTYCIYTYQSAFEKELLELKLAYKRDIIPIAYKTHIIKTESDFVIEGLLRVQMTLANHYVPTMFVRFSKI